jgi:hypothetical protein
MELASIYGREEAYEVIQTAIEDYKKL